MRNLSAVDESLDNATKEYVDYLRLSQFGQIDWYGHSLSTYTNISSDRNQGLSQRVSVNLGADANDKTSVGAHAAIHDGGISGVHFGGWASAYRNNTGAVDSNLFEPRRQAAVVYFGINDLAKIGPSNMTPFSRSMEAICSRLNAAAIYEDTDGSVTYSTGWTNNSYSPSSTYYASGNSYKTCNTAVSRTITIAVPSTFPGGTVALGFLTNASGHGGAFSFTVDSVGAGSLDCRNTQSKDHSTGSNGQWTPSVMRFTGLSSGSHTIVATVTAINTVGIFDSWWIESNSSPLLVLPLMHRCTSYASYASGPYTPTDSDVTNTLNPAISTVASGFGNAVTVDIDTTINKQSIYLSDGLHFSSRGHAAAAEVILKKIQETQLTRERQTRGAFEPGFLSKNPSSSNRNIIRTGGGVFVPLTIRDSILNDQTTDLTRWQIGGDTPVTVLKVDKNGSVQAATSGFAHPFSQRTSITDTYPLMAINSSGQLLFGAGGASATDITLYRRAAGILNCNGSIEAEDASNGFKSKVTGFGRGYSQWASFSDTYPKFQIGASGEQGWGAGGASAPDAFISRTSARQLTTTAIKASDSSLPAFKVDTGHGSGAAFDANSEGKIINVNDPTSAQDAATKNYVDSKPGCRVYRSTDQTNITNLSWVAVSFDSERYDPDNMWTSGANITIPKTGVYSLFGNIAWDGNTTGNRYIYIGGSTAGNIAQTHVTRSTSQYQVISSVAKLTSGEAVALYVFQDSGNTRTLSSGAPGQEFAVQYIRPV